MNARQIELARHALGLPNKSRLSYRNRFVAGPGNGQYEDWVAMVGAGHAGRFVDASFGGSTLFYLTRAGATAALRPGESLCPEDFPIKEGVSA